MRTRFAGIKWNPALVSGLLCLLALAFIIFARRSRETAKLTKSTNFTSVRTPPQLPPASLERVPDARLPVAHQQLSVDAVGPGAVQFARDGSTFTLRVSEPPGLQLWEITDGPFSPQLRWSHQLPRVPTVATRSPDGRNVFLVLSGESEERAAGWCKVAEQSLQSIAGDAGARHRGEAIRGARFTPDGKYAASYSDRMVVLWRSSPTDSSYQPVEAIEASETIRTCFFDGAKAPDAGKLVIVTSQRIEVRSCRESVSRVVATAEFGAHQVVQAIGDEDSSLVAVDDMGRAECWSWKQPEKMVSRPIKDWPGKLATAGWKIQPGRLLAAFVDEGESPSYELSMWNLAEPETARRSLAGHRRTIVALEMAEGGAWAVSADEVSVLVWNADSLESLRLFLPVRSGRMSSVGIAPGGNWILGITAEGYAMIWDLARIRRDWAALQASIRRK